MCHPIRRRSLDTRICVERIILIQSEITFRVMRRDERCRYTKTSVHGWLGLIRRPSSHSSPENRTSKYQSADSIRQSPRHSTHRMQTSLINKHIDRLIDIDLISSVIQSTVRQSIEYPRPYLQTEISLSWFAWMIFLPLPPSTRSLHMCLERWIFSDVSFTNSVKGTHRCKMPWIQPMDKPWSLIMDGWHEPCSQ